MKIKLPILVLAAFVVLTYQSMLPIADAQVPKGNNPLDDLFNRKREGLFIGGGIAYGTTHVIIPEYTSRFREYEVNIIGGSGNSGYMQWRIGYATSEYFAFYITSALTNLQPKLGAMLFNKDYSSYYFHALIGYSDAATKVNTPSVRDGGIEFGTNTLSFAGGIGYEFRPHFMTELTLEYSQLTFTDLEFTVRSITLFASFNYLFY